MPNGATAVENLLAARQDFFLRPALTPCVIVNLQRTVHLWVIISMHIFSHSSLEHDLHYFNGPGHSVQGKE